VTEQDCSWANSMLGAFHADLRNYAGVKIHVIAVGEFSSSSGGQLEYLRSLQARKHQAISDLHSGNRTGQRSSKHKSDESSNNILQFNFCATTLAEAKRRREAQRSTKTWEHFQAHRTVFGVIGFCEGHKNANVIKAYEQWNRAVAALYPDTPMTQFHILNPTKEQESDPRIRNSNSIKVYPYRASDKANAYFTDRIVLRLAINFKQTFFNWLRAADSGETSVLQRQGVLDLQTDPEGPGSQAPTPSGFSGVNSPASSTNSPQFSNARWRGRLSKWKGDYSLLVGLVSEAEAHYAKARDVCGSQRDYFWQGGAFLGTWVRQSRVFVLEFAVWRA